MEPIIETGNGVVTLIAEPGALTFATRKTWEPLPEHRLEELNKFGINMAFKGTSSVYFLLHEYVVPLGRDIESRYKLVKITNDEDEKLVFYYMNISAAECDQLQQNRLTLWD